jgi:hypothetical protein
MQYLMYKLSPKDAIIVGETTEARFQGDSLEQAGR